VIKVILLASRKHSNWGWCWGENHLRCFCGFAYFSPLAQQQNAYFLPISGAKHHFA
jgi:hypothetical protein